MYSRKQRGKPKRKRLVSGLTIPGEWTFRSPAVAKAFDSHVREQLPWYDLATGIVAHVARCYVPRGGVVIDVGASTGNVGRALAPMLAAREANLIAFNSSEDMAKVYAAPGQFVVADAETFDYEKRRPDLIVCFLALMFVPVARRAALVARIKAALNLGGAAIIFDKTVPQPGYVGTVAYRLTLAAKHEAGARADEIIAKELSISGFQRPLAASELDGFAEIFRFGDFAGFVHERS